MFGAKPWITWQFDSNFMFFCEITECLRFVTCWDLVFLKSFDNDIQTQAALMSENQFVWC